MLHPSYSDLMKVVNSEVEQGEAPVVNSRYSIVMATSKRARQIIGGEEPMVKAAGKKPLSVAIEELNQAKIRILSEEEAEQQRQQEELMESRYERNEIFAGKRPEEEEKPEDDLAADSSMQAGDGEEPEEDSDLE